jgi:hypothetical protein
MKNGRSSYEKSKSFAIRIIKLILISTFHFSLSTLSTAAPLSPESSMFFPILPQDASEFSEPKIVPIASNHDFNAKRNNNITRAIIAIPDETRNAAGMKQLLSEFAGSLNNSTLIISPQFMIPADLMQFGKMSSEEKKFFAVWNISDWTYGNLSLSNNTQEDSVINQAMGTNAAISSFDVIDKLVLFLAQKNIFPNLKNIIITGSGAGANFVQRYAMFTSIQEERLLKGISLHFLITGATSYIYQTDYRPAAYKKENDYTAQCKEMNDYPYGMDNLNPYAKKTGKNAARVSYGTKAVTYIMAKGADTVSDLNCQAMLQGSSGFERAENYQRYLSSIYNELSDANHVFNFISGNNTALNLYGSQCAVSVLFGSGFCNNSNPYLTEADQLEPMAESNYSLPIDENLYQSDINSAIEEAEPSVKNSHKGTSGILDGLDL